MGLGDPRVRCMVVLSHCSHGFHFLATSWTVVHSGSFSIGSSGKTLRLLRLSSRDSSNLGLNQTLGLHRRFFISESLKQLESGELGSDPTWASA